MKYKHNAIPAIIYLLMCFAAGLYPFLTPHQELAGVGIIMLASPWSMIGMDVSRGSTAADLAHYHNLTTCIIVGGCIFNAIILLVLFGYFNKSNDSSNGKKI